MLKHFNQIQNKVHDGSGIENPHNYLWYKSNGIYYPSKEEVLKGYKYPQKTKVSNKTTKKDLAKALEEAMGWDWINDANISKKCEVKLSKRQVEKLNQNYYVAITTNTMDKNNPYFTICNSINDFSDNPIKYGKVLNLSKKEMVWLTKIF